MRTLAIALAVTIPMVASAEVQVKFDRFKNQTEVSAAKGPTVDAINILWTGVYPGEALKTPAAVTLVLGSTADDWQYLRCHDVSFLADGKPVPVGKSVHQGDVLRSGVLESVFVPVPPASLQALAKAQKVELRLCTREKELDAQEMADLRGFVDAAIPRKK